MQQSQTNTSPDVKTGSENDAPNAAKTRQAADDKAQQDADEKLPESHRETSDESSREVDELQHSNLSEGERIIICIQNSLTKWRFRRRIKSY